LPIMPDATDGVNCTARLVQASIGAACWQTRTKHLSHASADIKVRHQSVRSTPRTGRPLEGDMRHKSHLLFVWLAELVRRNSILDAVEDLHDPPVLVAPGLDLLGPA
jgi:hypothetical protein